MAYGQKIKEIRRANLLSQEEFAKRAGVSRSIISQIEIDKIRPTLEALIRISKEFQVSLDYLMSNEPAPEETKELPLNDTNQFSLFSNDIKPMQANRKRELRFESAEPDIYLHQLKRFKEVPFLSMADRRAFGYGIDPGNLSFKLPKMLLPVESQGQLMAFEVLNEILRRREILICEISDLEAVHEHQLVVIATEEKILDGIIKSIDASTLTIYDTAFPIKTITSLWKVLLVLAPPDNTENLKEQMEKMHKLLDEMKGKRWI